MYDFINNRRTYASNFASFVNLQENLFTYSPIVVEDDYHLYFTYSHERPLILELFSCLQIIEMKMLPEVYYYQLVMILDN
jgi:hypothetical protein